MPVGTPFGETFDDRFHFLLGHSQQDQQDAENAEKPITSTNSPKSKEGKTVEQPNFDLQGQIKDALSTLIPEYLKGLSPEELKQRQAAFESSTEPRKVPEIDPLGNTAPGAMVAGGLDLASNFIDAPAKSM